jgi:hypothetical protein
VFFFWAAAGGHTYNETMAGGVYGNGTAAFYATFLPTPTAAGVLGNGIAALYDVFGPTPTAAGVLGNGADVDHGTYNPAIPSAGVWANGSATAQVLYTPQVTSAGVLGNGADVDQGVFNPVVAPAGVLGNGADVDQDIGNPSLTAAGVLGGGVATFAYNEAMVGGALAGGGELVNTVFGPSPAGGAYANGAAVAVADYFPAIAAAGIFGGGADADQEIDNPTAGAAGVLTGGADLDRATYNPLVPAAGVLSGGTSASVYDQSTAGGTAANGQANISAYYGLPVAGGGTYVAGGGVVAETYNVVAASAGGGLLAGAGTIAAVYDPQCGTGPVASGSATVVLLTGGLEPQGAVAGGQAKVGEATLTSGGGRLAGAAMIAAHYDWTVTGGGKANGLTIPLLDNVFPIIPTYHRFDPGDLVYLVSVPGHSYVPMRVAGLYYLGTNVYYEFDTRGTRRLVAEQFLLSQKDRRTQSKSKNRPFVREAARKLDRLKRVPLDKLRLIAPGA